MAHSKTMTEAIHDNQQPGETMTEALARVRKPGQTMTEAIKEFQHPSTPAPQPPAKPTKPSNLAGTPAATTIALTWDADPFAKKYTVSISPAVTGYPKDVTDATDNITGLTASTAYTVKVKACNDGGCSADTQKTITTTA